MNRKMQKFLEEMRRRGLLAETVPPAVPALPTRKKYGNRCEPRWIDGREVRFHSAREARRFDELDLAWRAGAIGRPLLQVAFPLYVEGLWVTTYVADFVYVDRACRELVVEDAKGYATTEYRLKKRLFFAIFGTKILET